MKPEGVLFVCLGNICRSPLAKVVFIEQAKARGASNRFDVDSCGTGHWHAGGPADPRTVAVAQRNGLRCDHTARVLDPATDFTRFEHLLVADPFIRDALLKLGAPTDRVHLLRSYDPQAHGRSEVPDPYEHGPEKFDEVYAIITRSCQGLLDELLDEME